MRKIVKNLAYIPISKRKLLEAKGNLKLYQDPKKDFRVFTKIKGKKHFFSIFLEEWNVNWQVKSDGEWFGLPHAAEKENDIIKLIFRKQFANIPGVKPAENHFFIWNFKLNGKKLVDIGPERPINPPDHANHKYFYPLINKTDKKRLKQLNVELFSDLEEWVISDKALKVEYISSGGGRKIH